MRPQKLDLELVKGDRFEEVLLRKGRPAKARDLLFVLVQPDRPGDVQLVAEVAQRLLRRRSAVALRLDDDVAPDAVLLAQNAPELCHWRPPVIDLLSLYRIATPRARGFHIMKQQKRISKICSGMNNFAEN